MYTYKMTIDNQLFQPYDMFFLNINYRETDAHE